MTWGFGDARAVSANGVNLSVREKGQGTPVILIHGAVSDLRTWHQQIDAMPDGYRAISYSRRYAHPNAPLPDGAGDPIEPHVDDLLALIDALGARPAHLVGHSFGGLVALLAALRAPGAVRSLTLVEPPAIGLLVGLPPRPAGLLHGFFSRPAPTLAVLRFALFTVARAKRAYRRGDDAAAIHVVGNGVLGPRAFAALTPERRHMIWQNRMTDRAQILDDTLTEVRLDRLSDLDLPVLLVGGANSPVLFRYILDALEKRLPRAQRVRIADASHIVHEDNPVDFAAELGRFLSSRR